MKLKQEKKNIQLMNIFLIFLKNDNLNNIIESINENILRNGLINFLNIMIIK